jgi:hypothetical protein
MVGTALLLFFIMGYFGDFPPGLLLVSLSFGGLETALGLGLEGGL